MKQDICCLEQADRWLNLIGRYPGEDVKVVYGTAKRDFICDSTGEPIKEGERCAAVSVSTERTPYFPWEHNYINPEKES